MASRKSARLSASAANQLAQAEQASASMPPPPAAAPSRKRKAAASISEPPRTPTKRRAPAPSAAPPATPTPAAVGLIAEPANGLPATPSPSKPRNRAIARIADPHATNAPLLSPETSRVISRTPALLPAPVAATLLSPTKKRESSSEPIADLPKSQAGEALTTATILAEANAHLIRVDPRMKPLVDGNHCHVFSPEGLAERIDPFESLASGIISQQVSGAAAKAIKARFVGLFSSNADQDGGDVKEEVRGAQNGAAKDGKPRFPHPSEVAATSLEKLRTAGLSQRKAEYLQGLALKFSSGELSAQMLADAPYEELIAKLTAIRGIGIWSAEMFATFGLKRMDVFSLGDLGVQRGMAAFVGRDVAKLKSKGGKWKYMSEKEMSEMAERFRPYRSLFMWYMWRVEETDISTME